MSQKILYIFESQNGLIKIGISKKPKVRSREIEVNSGFKIKRQAMLGPITNPYYIETIIHQHFKKNRVIGEWFNIPFNKVVNFATKIVNTYGKYVVEKKENTDMKKIFTTVFGEIPYIENNKDSLNLETEECGLFSTNFLKQFLFITSTKEKNHGKVD